MRDLPWRTKHAGAYAEGMQRTGKGELEKDIVNGKEREEVTKWLSEIEKRKKDENEWIMKEGKRMRERERGREREQNWEIRPSK